MRSRIRTTTALGAGLLTPPLGWTAGLPGVWETCGQPSAGSGDPRTARWPLTLEAFANPNNYWPIEWLKRIARYPHDNDTWLGGPHTIIANGEPPEPFAPNTKLSCLLLANPSEFGRCTRPTVARSDF